MIATMPNETASVRIPKDRLQPAKVAAAAAGVTLEAWLAKAIDHELEASAVTRTIKRLKREAASPTTQ